MKAFTTIILVLFSLLCLSQSKDTFDVYFPLNETRLTRVSRNSIDMFILKDSLLRYRQLIIIGYADHLGSDTHNDSLSTQRATTVKDHLITKGFPVSNVLICIGKGSISRQDTSARHGNAADRKVQIIVGNTSPAIIASHSRPLNTEQQIFDIAHMQVNQVIPLKNIFFYEGKARILPSSIPALKNLYDMLSDNITVHIRIEGHVCCKTHINESIDSESEAVKLSIARAKIVYDYLIAKGIAVNRISYIGLGISKPAIFPANTEDEKNANRRVEIRILQR